MTSGSLNARCCAVSLAIRISDSRVTSHNVLFAPSDRQRRQEQIKLQAGAKSVETAAGSGFVGCGSLSISDVQGSG